MHAGFPRLGTTCNLSAQLISQAVHLAHFGCAGLQKPLKWLPPSKLWVLNADVHLNEDGDPVPPDDSPYLWLGDVCSGRPDTLQAEMQTGQYLIADSNTNYIATLPLDKSVLCTLIATLKKYYEPIFAAVLCVLRGYVVAVHYESLI